jgi:hypothetical protein
VGSDTLWSVSWLRRIFFSRGHRSLYFLYVIGGLWTSGGTSEPCRSDLYFSKGGALIARLFLPLSVRCCRRNGPNGFKFGLRPSREALVSLPESRPGRPSAKPSSSVVVVSQRGKDILAEGPLAHDIVKNQAEMSLGKPSRPCVTF